MDTVQKTYSLNHNLTWSEALKLAQIRVSKKNIASNLYPWINNDFHPASYPKGTKGLFPWAGG
jgi:hypothetical protein